MVQPKTEARPRRARTRRGEEQAPLVESQLSVTNDVIMDGEEGSPRNPGRVPEKVPEPLPLLSAPGIDGPAAFLGSEVPDLGLKIQQPPPASAAVTDSNGDAETPLSSKTDLQELLQRQGESSVT